MTRVSICYASVVLLGLLCAAAAAAQEVPSAGWTIVQQLPTGSEIQVTIGSGRSLRGALHAVREDSLTINTNATQEIVARQDLRRLAVKRPGHRGRNTLIGLAVGLGAGLATGAGVDAQANHSNWFPNAGKTVFSPLGAIVGTVVGVAWPTGGWREVYRAP